MTRRFRPGTGPLESVGNAMRQPEKHHFRSPGTAVETLPADDITGWCYVRLGRFGEIRMLQHEGIKDQAYVFRLVYADIEFSGIADDILYGVVGFDGGRALAFTELHTNGVSRIYMLVRNKTARGEARLAGLRQEASTLLRIYNALPDNCVNGALNMRTITSIAVIQVDASQTPLASWFSEDASIRAVAPILALKDDRLQAHIATLVSALTQDWDWNDPSRCAPVSGMLGTDILLQIVPSSAQGSVLATLTFEPVRMRRTLSDTFATRAITARESDVVRLVMTGRSVKEIASALSVAECTIQDHIKNVLAKTNARNRSQMIATLLGFRTS